jgi:hypothetical protein
MNKRTNLVKLKVRRARRHAAELNETIRAFFQKTPYKTTGEIDAETGDKLFKVSRCLPVPREIPLIIGDVLQNLRTALDHLVWQLVEANGGKPNKGTAFPFAKTAQDYRNESSRRLKGVPEAAIKMIDDLRPYAGGNEDLYSLHHLNNHDKHRLLLIVGAAHTVTTYSTRVKIYIPSRKITFPLTPGKVLCKIPKQFVQHLQNDPEFEFRIGFGDAGNIRPGDSVSLNLDRMPGTIATIVNSFDRFLT